MSVPKEIREVPRPKNTVVMDSGIEGPRRYRVHKRLSVRYLSGRNPQPVYGKAIGHIIDGKYVPFVPMSFSFSFGGSAFAHSVSEDIYEDLVAAFGKKDAELIYVLGIVRATKPFLIPERLEVFYKNSYSGYAHSDLDLAPEKIDALLGKIDRNHKKVCAFFDLRTARFAEYDAVEAVRPADSLFRSGDERFMIKCTYVPDCGEILRMEPVPKDTAGTPWAKGQPYFSGIYSAFSFIAVHPVSENVSYTAFSSVFMNCISCMIMGKMYKKAEEAGVLNEMSFTEMLSILNNCQKKWDADRDKLLDDEDWKWLPMEAGDLFKALGFVKHMKPRRRRAHT